MPVNFYQQGEKCFARWGRQGKKYYYKCGDKSARQRARKKAEKQGRAVKANEGE